MASMTATMACSGVACTSRPQPVAAARVRLSGLCFRSAARGTALSWRAMEGRSQQRVAATAMAAESVGDDAEQMEYEVRGRWLGPQHVV